MGPSSRSTCSAGASTAAASATSTGMTSGLPPARRTSSAAAARPVSPRASRATAAPRAANATAVARPMPPPAPVTTTTRVPVRVSTRSPCPVSGQPATGGGKAQNPRMADRWYRNAVLYCLDVETFQDSNGDGVGDLQGLMGRLDYLARLGVTCLWLNPVHPSPRRDDGYDITDFYGVHPRIGTLGDFAELVHQAGNRGLRVMIDLVGYHPSDEHPWFRSACSSRESRYRDWYVWSDTEPADRRQGMVFPGEQTETWTWSEEAGAWYYHRFYDFQPDLTTSNRAVQAEVERIMDFWLALGVAGFRMDAAPFIIALTEPGNPNSPKDFDQLTRYRERISWRRGDAVVLAEANVENAELVKYFGDSGGTNNRLPMLFDFVLSVNCLLALARGAAQPILRALDSAPAIPNHAQWATFLRNHDEVDLSRLSPEEMAECFAAFGPDKDMQLYGRGIRRRLGPLLNGN